jgi:hypothetical protein
MQGVSLKFLWQRQQFARVHGSSGPIEELLRTSTPDAIGYAVPKLGSLRTKILEARVGFEPTGLQPVRKLFNLRNAAIATIARIA